MTIIITKIITEIMILLYNIFSLTTNNIPFIFKKSSRFYIKRIMD